MYIYHCVLLKQQGLDWKCYCLDKLINSSDWEDTMLDPRPRSHACFSAQAFTSQFCDWPAGWCESALASRRGPVDVPAWGTHPSGLAARRHGCEAEIGNSYGGYLGLCCCGSKVFVSDQISNLICFATMSAPCQTFVFPPKLIKAPHGSAQLGLESWHFVFFCQSDSNCSADNHVRPSCMNEVRPIALGLRRNDGQRSCYEGRVQAAWSMAGQPPSALHEAHRVLSHSSLLGIKSPIVLDAAHRKEPRETLWACEGALPQCCNECWRLLESQLALHAAWTHAVAGESASFSVGPMWRHEPQHILLYSLQSLPGSSEVISYVFGEDNRRPASSFQHQECWGQMGRVVWWIWWRRRQWFFWVSQFDRVISFQRHCVHG